MIGSLRTPGSLKVFNKRSIPSHVVKSSMVSGSSVTRSRSIVSVSISSTSVTSRTNISCKIPVRNACCVTGRAALLIWYNPNWTAVQEGWLGDPNTSVVGLIAEITLRVEFQTRREPNLPWKIPFLPWNISNSKA